MNECVCVCVSGMEVRYQADRGILNAELINSLLYFHVLGCNGLTSSSPRGRICVQSAPSKFPLEVYMMPSH